MSIVSIICFISFSLLLFSFLKKGTDIFSPARLFILVWSFAIGLTDLKLSGYQFTWSFYSWFMLFLPLISVLVGMFVIYVINQNKPVSTINFTRSALNDSIINSNILFQATLLLFIAFIVSYLVSYLVIGYVPLFTKYPGTSRVNWGIFGFGLFIQSFPSIIYFGALYLVIVKRNHLRKFIVSLIILASFITYAFLLQRYYVVFAIIVSGISLYYLSRIFNPRNVLIILVCLIAIMYSMTFVRFSTTIANYLYYTSRMKISIKYAFVTEPYMYIVMNLENFAHAVEKLYRFTYGVYTFDFIFALTGIKHPLAEYLSLSDYPGLITGGYNTYTMFFVYYRDFGILGLGILPFMMGSAFSFSYYKMKQSPNINSISVYAIFAFVILFSFFIPIVTFLHFIFNFFIIFIVTKLIITKDNILG